MSSRMLGGFTKKPLAKPLLVATAALMGSLVSMGASVALAQSTGTSMSSGDTELATEGGTKAIPQRQLPGASAGVSTASIADNSPLARKRFSFTLLNETQFAPKEGVDTDTNAPISGLNRFQLGYELSATKKLMIREDSNFKQPLNRDVEYHITDPYIGYTATKFATLPFDWVITVQPRIYLPLGEKTRFETHAAGAEGLVLVADKSVGKFDFELMAMGVYYNNTQDYVWKFDSAKGQWKSAGVQDWMSLFQTEVAYNITDKLAISHDVYLFTKATRASTTDAASTSTILWNETTIGYQLMKQVRVMASVENDAAFDNQNAVSMYQQKDMLYNLYFKLSL